MKRAPRGERAWSADVAWFDFATASNLFIARCGPDVILISIEVSKPEVRELEAIYQVRDKPGRTFFVRGGAQRVDWMAAGAKQNAARIK